MKPKEAYEELVKRVGELDLLRSGYAVLQWDHEVYMPSGGAENRAATMAFLAGMIHEKFVDPRINELITTVEGSTLVSNPESDEAANIRELRYQYDKQTRLPKELVEEINKTRMLAHHEWAEARRNRDFKKFQPWLEKIINLTRQKAEAYGYDGEPYDPLLDDYEPGSAVESIADTLGKLRSELVELLGRITDAGRKPNPSIIERPYDVDRQKIFSEIVCAAIGYDFTDGRLDIATHPFTIGIGPGDTRITTRYNPKRFNDAIFGTIHEAGHALYDMGLERKKHRGMPMGDSISLGIHESQSRMWENLVGRSRPFWTYFFPIAKSMFFKSLDGVSLDEFYGAINYVAPSYIRVEADEVTYNLHILLRFELERAIIKGDLKTGDIPGEWNSRFEKYFGLKVDHDANGCLQDVHWSSALFGYFPTYALGNIYSAQFFNQARKDIPNLEKRFERGDFIVLREWLRDNIHRHGQRYRAEELSRRITGSGLDHKPLMEYLNVKFAEIYGF